MSLRTAPTPAEVSIEAHQSIHHFVSNLKTGRTTSKSVIMINIVKSMVIILLVSVIASSYAFKLTAVDVEPNMDNYDEFNKEYTPYLTMIDKYRGEQSNMDDVPTFDTRYRTWKRNADLINSLLALPKGMSDAGR